MIELAKKHIYQNSTLKLEEAKEMVTTVLDFLEKEGMLPPMTNYFIVNKPEGFVQHWSEVDDYCLWEPEDD